ncbi:hypothetical protein KY289_017732 [Solanum tuberosum]|nr:hypothetical protein KY289_017732 [Solanum tuberosum]
MDESEFIDSMDMGGVDWKENKNSELVGKEIESFGISGGSLEIRSMGIDDGLELLFFLPSLGAPTPFAPLVTLIRNLQLLKDVKAMGGSLE